MKSQVHLFFRRNLDNWNSTVDVDVVGAAMSALIEEFSGKVYPEHPGVVDVRLADKAKEILEEFNKNPYGLSFYADVRRQVVNHHSLVFVLCEDSKGKINVLIKFRVVEVKEEGGEE